jgi:hypothetical protein
MMKFFSADRLSRGNCGNNLLDGRNKNNEKLSRVRYHENKLVDLDVYS